MAVFLLSKYKKIFITQSLAGIPWFGETQVWQPPPPLSKYRMACLTQGMAGILWNGETNI
jgi:hypothetical protein